MTTLEGVCKTLNPSFDYTNVIKNIIINKQGKQLTYSVINKVFNDIGTIIKNQSNDKKDLMANLQQDKILKVQISKVERSVNNRLLLLFIINILLQVF